MRFIPAWAVNLHSRGEITHTQPFAQDLFVHLVKIIIVGARFYLSRRAKNGLSNFKLALNG